MPNSPLDKATTERVKSPFNRKIISRRATIIANAKKETLLEKFQQMNLQSIGHSAEVNVLKDKATYRSERETNISDFRMLMDVFNVKKLMEKKN